MGHTAIEKIFAKHAHVKEVFPGETVFCDVDLIMCHSPQMFAENVEQMSEMGMNFLRVFDPDKIAFTLGHHICLPSDDAMAQAMAVSRDVAKKYGIKHVYDMGTGNGHLLMIERGHAYPGSLCVGGDSHSTIYGCVGAFGTASSLDMPETLLTGKTWFTVPETVRTNLHGALMKGVAPRDVAQYLLSYIGADGALNQILEYSGQFIKSLDVYQRMIFSLLAYEMGAVTGFIEADEVTLDFCRNRVGAPYEVVIDDADCNYSKEWDVNVSKIEPMIACPPRPTNVKPVSEVEKEDIVVHQAFLGGCTGSSLGDFRMAADVLRGRELHPDVRLLVVPGTNEIAREMRKEGLTAFFEDLGAVITPPYCGPCQMVCFGHLGKDEVMIGTHPRNQAGRAGQSGGVYLGSPYSVAAAAIAGTIVDPRRYM